MNNNPYSGSAVKRSAIHFLVGKVASALLTFTVLLWLVRLLSIADYSAYITFVAALDMTIAFSSIGLPWMAARYLPEFRLHAPKTVLIRFILQLMKYQFGVLVLTAGLMWLSLDWSLLQLDMTAYRQTAQWYVLMLIIDGSGRNLRDCILNELLQQKLAQFSLVIRNLTFVIGLSVLVYTDQVNLKAIVIADIIASSVGVVLSLLGLHRYLTQLTDEAKKPDWMKPQWSEMWSVAFNMYFSHIVTLVYSVPMFTLVIRYCLGTESTAIFGFIRNLYGQIGNYLPASLLFGLIRPKLVASYVGDGGIAELTRNANIVGKFSLFVLMPLLVFAWLSGEVLLAQLSGGKFPHTGYYFACLLCALIPASQRQILETVAVVTNNSYLCNYAALIGILTLPVTYGLIQLGFDLWAPIIAVISGDILFYTTIVFGVIKKASYHADFSGFCRMLLTVIISYLGSMQLLIPGYSWLWIIGVAVLACSVFLLVAAIIKPFSDLERLRINQLIKRNLFIW
jgi:O-antigen/teichoic acid export membrane protein